MPLNAQILVQFSEPVDSETLGQIKLTQGANMVNVLENLSLLVRERLNMAAKMKAHTAQQRFSAALLCIMPIVVGIGFWIVKPEYIKLLYTDPIGSKFLTYAVISEIVPS